MTTIQVLGWDDPRGRDPLAAAAREFERRTPGVSIRIETRSLAAFEDQPVEEVTRTHDVICIDHPFIGEAATRGLFLPLELAVDAEWLDRHRADCIGPTFASYTWAGQQWAFAVDAACQVSAWRPDLLERLSLARPQRAEDIIRVARAHPGRVALALNPIHAACTFVTLCAGATGALAGDLGFEVPDDIGRWAVEFLRELARYCHPLSRAASPVTVLESMANEADGIAYSPMLFGYSNYARRGYRAHGIAFGDPPSPMDRGSILGGVGLAISADSRTVPEAAAFAAFVASPEFQRHELVAAGGQPASRSAWEDPRLDATVEGFFSATRSTMERAFVRPRFPDFHRHQRLMADRLHALIWDETAPFDKIPEVLAALVRQGSEAAEPLRS